MDTMSAGTLRWSPGSRLPYATRQLLSECLQVARIVTSSLIAIAVGLVSLSYGIASLGLDTLTQLVRELSGKSVDGLSS